MSAPDLAERIAAIAVERTLGFTPGTVPFGVNVRTLAKAIRDELAKAPEIEEVQRALEPFHKYAEARIAKPFSNLSDEIHCIHVGTPWEASITFTECKATSSALRALDRITGRGKA